MVNSRRGPANSAPTVKANLPFMPALGRANQVPDKGLATGKFDLPGATDTYSLFLMIDETLPFTFSIPFVGDPPTSLAEHSPETIVERSSKLRHRRRRFRTILQIDILKKKNGIFLCLNTYAQLIDWCRGLQQSSEFVDWIFFGPKTEQGTLGCRDAPKPASPLSWKIWPRKRK